MKKKLSLVMLFVLTFLIGIIYISKKEVNAAPSGCTVYRNYYLFLDVSSLEVYNDKSTYPDTTRTTNKIFGLGIPDGASIESQGAINITTSDSTTNDKEMPLRQFYDIYDDVIEAGQTLKLNDTTYVSNGFWSGEGCNDRLNVGASSSCGSIDIRSYSDTYFHFVQHLAKLNTATVANVSRSSITAKTTTTSITRSFTPADVENISTTLASNIKVWSPSVYYIDWYDPSECSVVGPVGPEEPEERGSIYIEYKDKDTDNKITRPIDANTGSLYKNPFTLKNNELYGESYAYLCPSLVGYTLYDKENDQETLVYSISGSISSPSETFSCYYKKNVEPELSILHLETNTDSPILRDNVRYTSSDGLKVGSEFSHECQDTIIYNNITYKRTNENVSKVIEEGANTLVCYYDPTFTLTVNYGEDENCNNSIKSSDIYNNLSEGTPINHKVVTKIGNMSNPRLGTYSSGFTSLPTLNGDTLSIVMPKRNVNICIVYTPQTGSTWMYVAWIVALLALGYSIYYFTKVYKKKKNEI